ncbi:chaperonin 10-like protein [Aspergillus insuetus]
MLSIGINSHTKPSEYQLLEFPQPEITDQTDVLIKVHAASIGYDAAGAVTAPGPGVTRFRVGDAVYVRLPESHRGAWTEFAVCPERFIALKPPSLSFDKAATMPLAAMTAYQVLKKYDSDLSGKTVFVPAGLGGTGLFAC